MEDHFTHALVCQNRLIGIVEGERGFSFNIYESPASPLSPGQGGYYPDLETVLSAAIESAEKESQWSAGFKSRVQGEPLLKTAHPDFKEGWEEALRLSMVKKCQM